MPSRSREPDDASLSAGADDGGLDGFAAPRVHIEMLDDELRTSSFLAAIREVVDPEDVVVDIGTGTGVLAAGAALAGARRVYAVEETSIGEAASALFRANDVDDRVTLIAGRSTRIYLPERASVVVCELLGNDVFDERILEVMRDTRLRHTVPDARLIPRSVRVLALPLEVPREELLDHMFGTEHVERWRSAYGIDFACLARHALVNPEAFLPSPQLRTWRRMGDPVLLVEIDLATVDATELEAEALSVASAAGTVTGVLVYFEAVLSPSITLSMHPDHAGADCSWKSKITLLSKPIDTVPGDRLRLRYSFRKQSRLDVERVP